MSEFSESYHLKADSEHTAIALLKNAVCEGYVFKESNGWICGKMGSAARFMEWDSE